MKAISTFPLVLTLIAEPTRGALDDTTATAVRGVLERSGFGPGAIDWLAPETACDIPLAAGETNDIRAAAIEILGDRPVDAVAQAAGGRRKSILIADMESTIIANEMLDELAELVDARERVAGITARAMNGEIDFADALRERVALLAGLDAGVLQQTRACMTVNPGARALIATMGAHGARTILVSGGFECFATPLAADLGFDQVAANRLQIENGMLTGSVIEPILDRDAKLRALNTAARDQGVGPAQVIAVGDGANDLPMLLAAGAGVAWHAKAHVAASAPIRVDHGDLTALLFLQGYRVEGYRVDAFRDAISPTP